MCSFPELPILLSTSQTLTACPQLGVNLKIIVEYAKNLQRKDGAIIPLNFLIK